MTSLTIRTIPDPVLKDRATDVTLFDDALRTLIDDMFETMYAARGIGLAAPQVGLLQRVVVIDLQEEGFEPLDLVNPVIISAEGTMTSEEGCLSIPDYRDAIKRSERVVVAAQDRNGDHYEVEAEGLLACCLQHEIDHLNGVLFVDHLSRLKREFYRRWLKKFLAEQSEV